MLSNETARKLREMRMGVMAETISAQLENAKFHAVSFFCGHAVLFERRIQRPPPDSGRTTLNAPAVGAEQDEFLPTTKLETWKWFLKPCKRLKNTV